MIIRKETIVKATAEKIQKAIRDLDDETRQDLIGGLAEDPEFVEDLLDTLELIRSRSEPARPYDKFRRELKLESK